MKISTQCVASQSQERYILQPKIAAVKISLIEQVAGAVLGSKRWSELKLRVFDLKRGRVKLIPLADVFEYDITKIAVPADWCPQAEDIGKPIPIVTRIATPYEGSFKLTVSNHIKKQMFDPLYKTVLGADVHTLVAVEVRITDIIGRSMSLRIEGSTQREEPYIRQVGTECIAHLPTAWFPQYHEYKTPQGYSVFTGNAWFRFNCSQTKMSVLYFVDGIRYEREVTDTEKDIWSGVHLALRRDNAKRQTYNRTRTYWSASTDFRITSHQTEIATVLRHIAESTQYTALKQWLLRIGFGLSC